MGTYSKGSITRVELHNFMTYDHIIQYPGPKINFILGRNGSGKSSIVCAIALCCGSTPSFIGRAQHLADFIKHGKATASAELTLANPDGNPIKIRRVFHRSKTGNECYYNGERVLLEVYLERIKDLNIMTDNLVQFLPQERVIDFSLMTSVQLLENTEKTIGQVNLAKMHEDLKKAGTKWGEAAAEINQLRKGLEDARDREVQLRQDVEALSVREGLLTAMTLASVKKDRLAIVKEQEKLKESKSEIEKTEKILEKTASHVLPFRNKMQKGKSAFSSATKNITLARRTLEAAVHSYKPDVYASEPEKLQSDNMKDFATLNGLEKTHEERQEKIRQHQTAIGNLQAQATQTDVQEIKEKMSGILEETKSLRLNIDGLNQERQKFVVQRRNLDDDIQTKSTEVTRLEQSEDDRVRFLRTHNDQLLRAKIWIHDNRQRLKGKVYGPLFLEINLKEKNLRHASIVESMVPRELLNMFICDNEDDVDILLNEMVQGQRLRFPVKHVRMGARRSDMIDPERLKRTLECETMVSDLIEAPPLVLQFLCNRFQFNNVPVYNDWSDQLLDKYKRAIQDRSGKLLAPRMFAANTTFKFRKTGFSQNMATTSQETRPAQLMDKVMVLRTGKPDTTALRNQVESLKNRQAQVSESEKNLQQKMDKLQEVYNTLNKEVADGKAQIQDAERIKRRIQELEKEITRLQAVVVDFEGEKRKVAEKVRLRNASVLQKILAAHKNKGTEGTLLDNAVNLTADFASIQSEAQKQSGDLIESLETMRTIWDDLTNSVRRHARFVDAYKEHLNQHVELIRSVPGSENGKLPQDALKQYSELPSDEEKLNNQMKARRAQLNAAGDINVNARLDLERHVMHMRNLEKDITAKGANIEKEKERMAQLRTQWTETVQSLADRIGRSFSQYYKSMDLAGDVVLQKPENPDHFENYGYQIKVSYRPNRPLETLSGQVHSGGEKSVATALYMLAIQELTKCPFRVVDEINQGMDADNERRVFRMIVETASRCGGQYFILSPKLLPDLHLTKDVTVTVIFSGSEMHSGPRLEDWDLITIAKRMTGIDLASLPTSSTQTISQPNKSINKRKRDIDEEEEPEVSTSPESLKENPRLARKHARLANVN